MYVYPFVCSSISSSPCRYVSNLNRGIAQIALFASRPPFLDKVHLFYGAPFLGYTWAMVGPAGLAAPSGSPHCNQLVVARFAQHAPDNNRQICRMRWPKWLTICRHRRLFCLGAPTTESIESRDWMMDGAIVVAPRPPRPERINQSQQQVWKWDSIMARIENYFGELLPVSRNELINEQEISCCCWNIQMWWIWFCAIIKSIRVPTESFEPATTSNFQQNWIE